MSEKSHVGMGYYVCPICGKEHDEVVLLDKRLRKSLPRRQAIDWARCPEHEKMHNEGYVALVEVTNKSAPVNMNDANRTGRFVHIRKEAWPHMFNAPIPEKQFGFCPPGVIEALEAKMPKESDETDRLQDPHQPGAVQDPAAPGP